MKGDKIMGRTKVKEELILSEKFINLIKILEKSIEKITLIKN